MAFSTPVTTTTSPSPSPSPSRPQSQSLIKRPSSASDALMMAPPPLPKRIKRPATVLDEDEYTDALSHIIARDFFPGLLETQTQREYLDALESRDKEWIKRAGKNLEAVMTPRIDAGGRRSASTTATRFERSGSATPKGGSKWAGGDTPLSVAGSTTSINSRSEDGSTAGRDSMVDVRNMSLSMFQSKYTSEDNESFNKLLDKQNVKKRQKYAWMWNGNKILTPRQIAFRKREAERTKRLPPPPLSSSPSSTSLSLSASASVSESEGVSNKNNKQVQLITTDQDARPAQPDAWASKPENALMFIPSSVEDTHETVAQRAESTSRAGPKQVIYNNTRVQHTPPQPDGSANNSNAIPPSPSLSAIRDAIAGHPHSTGSEPSYTGAETPRVNGYAFVDEDEPTPQPPDDEENSAYHLSLLKMNIDTSSSATPNPFTIRENRRRELLHHRMVERVATIKRAERSGKDVRTPVPKFPSSPMIAFGKTPGSGGRTPGVLGGKGLSKASLTPAAQRLWAAVGSMPGRRGGSEEGSKDMWTPKRK
ncbi:Es2 superfamily domain-containing protein [Histoplasma ohiense]|nr:Es2 superfamily domain-containing protein [Histoplasma ohiense (nom. inval.)]